jgi:hypothetical protein
MRSRACTVLGISTICGAVFALWFALSGTPRPPINEDSFRQIEPGMKEAEIEALVGVPAGWYAGLNRELFGSPLRVRRTFFSAEGDTDGEGRRIKGWAGDNAAVLVIFDNDGRVVTTIHSRVMEVIRR